MPIKKSERKGAEKPLAVTLPGGDVLNVRYLPNLVTKAYQDKHAAWQREETQRRQASLAPDELDARREAADDSETFGQAKQLADVLAWWDYEGEDGQPVPITPDELLDMDLELLTALNTTITRDMNQGLNAAIARDTADGAARPNEVTAAAALPEAIVHLPPPVAKTTPKQNPAALPA